MELGLAGKVVAVTGASGGMEGRALWSLDDTDEAAVRARLASP